MEKNDRIILIDADVVSHFISAEETDSLPNIFPNNPIYILDKVHAELQRWPSTNIRNQISLLFKKKILKLMVFPETNDEIKQEYFWIKSMRFRGDGESACLAVARYYKNILASSNLKDIKDYCIMHKIDYLTTMDFLCQALSTNFYDINRCNKFISRVLQAGSKLPCRTMSEFRCRKIDFLNTY